MKTKLLFLLLAATLIVSNISAQYSVRHIFSSTEGNSPGSLFSDGTFLYGMATSGGTNGTSIYGTIFKIEPNNAIFSKLFDFSGTNGGIPAGSLISDGTYLYGMTAWAGVIFKIKPDGTGYVVLHSFAGSDGATPLGSLISDGTFLYGMTRNGGTGGCTDGCGVIFKIKPDGTGYVKLFDFAGTSNGSNPNGSLISDGTFLYGMTAQGGTNNYGTIFKIKPDGTGYAKLLDFAGASNGKLPYGDLISDGTFLYGMTQQGGTIDSGTVFKIKQDGTGYAKLLDFAGMTNGSYPRGSLISVGNFLYGMTYQGGANTKGTIFKIKPDGTGYSKLLDFSGSDGAAPRGSLISDGSVIYGTTSSGGGGSGTIFSYCIPVAFDQILTVCAGQSITVGSTTYNTTGTFTKVLTSSHGCDSTVTTYLTVLPANTFSQTKTVCAGQSIIVGIHTYTSSGTYTDVLTSLVNGCDSTITTNLTVNDTSITISNATLTANATNATYQWIDCNNANTQIAGQTNQSFTAIVNGNYAVIVTQNSCSDTSSCYTINTLGLVENSFATAININPNPFTSQTTITFTQGQKNVSLQITDALGKDVKTISFTGKQLIIEKGEMKAGTYFIHVKTEQGIVSKKIIINK